MAYNYHAELINVFILNFACVVAGAVASTVVVVVFADSNASEDKHANAVCLSERPFESHVIVSCAALLPRERDNFQLGSN